VGQANQIANANDAAKLDRMASERRLWREIGSHNRCWLMTHLAIRTGSGTTVTTGRVSVLCLYFQS
jgi:hypothetical protein